MVWTAEVPVSRLRQKRRWKVEFFVTSPTQNTKSGFPSAVLRDIVDERKKTLDPQSFPEKSMNYIGLENVESTTGDLIDFNPKLGKAIRSRSKRFYEGDVLYGRLRPYLNKVFVATGSVASGICSGEFYVLVSRQGLVLPNYLRAILSSKYVQQHVVSWLTGSALPRLQVDDLLGIEVPLPPMEQQRGFEDFLVSQDNLRRCLKQDLETLEIRNGRVFVEAIERGSIPVPSDGEASY